MIPILKLQDKKGQDEEDKIFDEYAKKVIILTNDPTSYLKHKEGEHLWQRLRHNAYKNLFDIFFVSHEYDVRNLMQNFDWNGYIVLQYRFNNIIAINIDAFELSYTSNVAEFRSFDVQFAYQYYDITDYRMVSS